MTKRPTAQDKLKNIKLLTLLTNAINARLDEEHQLVVLSGSWESRTLALSFNQWVCRDIPIKAKMPIIACIYPDDTEEVIDNVVACALDYQIDPMKNVKMI